MGASIKYVRTWGGGLNISENMRIHVHLTCKWWPGGGGLNLEVWCIHTFMDGPYKGLYGKHGSQPMDG